VGGLKKGLANLRSIERITKKAHAARRQENQMGNIKWPAFSIANPKKGFWMASLKSMA
jgi:hypothetical protein